LYGNSNGTDDLAVGEVIALDGSNNEGKDVVQGFAVSNVPNAVSATIFILEDMTNHVRKYNNLLVTVGLRMMQKMNVIVLKCSRCFLKSELVEIIACETDT
jgi:hypothetical protein